MTYRKGDYLYTPDQENVVCICADKDSAVFAPVYVFRHADGQTYLRTIYKGLFVLSNDTGPVEGYYRLTRSQIEEA